MKYLYPFTALVGQEKMKLALILTVINPLLGGVLIRGEKGTAKSTAVRALAALLPDQNIRMGCLFGCDPDDPDNWCDFCKDKSDSAVCSRRRPLVELPIGATEDRLLGSLNLEEALSRGESRFEPGILAAAHRGLLYVDEVNLLDDHLVDSLLDAAAMGRNTVEREGLSVTHPARFTLIGTMNPEEGELRPQLLDRFGLCVEVRGLEEPELRREVVKRRLRYEADPESFMEKSVQAEQELGKAIDRAGQRLKNIAFNEDILAQAVDICLKLMVDGHRGDLTVIKTALTLAAWRGQESVEPADIVTAAELALPHRMRRKPFQEVDFDVKGRLAASTM